MSRPVAIGFDMGRRNTANLPAPGGVRVRYACSKCSEELSRWLGTDERFCHHCGKKIDWNVILYLNSSQSDSLESAEGQSESEYVDLVNRLNDEKNFFEPVFVAEVM